MRLWTALLVSLAASVALPSVTNAQIPSPGRILGLASAPLRMMLHGMPRPRGFRHRRTTATRATAAREPAEQSQTGTEQPQAVVGAPAAAATAGGAYQDLLGYALWPNDYADRFWSHGYGDIIDAALSGSKADASGDDGSRRRHKRQRNARSPADGNAAQACRSQVIEQAAQPLDRLTKDIDLTDSQRAALDVLRAAFAEAFGRDQTVCRDDPAMNSAQRLDAMTQHLWALHDAAVFIRTPVQDFYSSLTDDQKVKLRTEPPQDGNEGPAQPAGAQACLAQARAGESSPVSQIERAVALKRTQRPTLEQLQTKTSTMAQFLLADCPQTPLATPVERLDAAAERVSDMLFAAMGTAPAFTAFYDALSVEQKSRLNRLSQ